jgi:hypothetical protein
MTRRFAVALLSSALGFSTSSAAQPHIVPVERFSCARGPFALRLPRTLPEVMKLAPLQRMEILPGELGDGFTTLVRYVQFQGLRLGLVTFSNDAERYLVSYAEIASRRWAHVSPFLIGESAALAHFQLGTHAPRDPELKAVYGGRAADVSFILSRGKLARVRYACYGA